MTAKELKKKNNKKNDDRCNLEKLGKASMEIGEIGKLDKKNTDKVCKDNKEKC